MTLPIAQPTVNVRPVRRVRKEVRAGAKVVLKMHREHRDQRPIEAATPSCMITEFDSPLPPTPVPALDLYPTLGPALPSPSTCVDLCLFELYALSVRY